MGKRTRVCKLELLFGFFQEFFCEILKSYSSASETRKAFKKIVKFKQLVKLG